MKCIYRELRLWDQGASQRSCIREHMLISAFLLSDLSFGWMAGPLRAGKSCCGEGTAVERWNRWSEFYKAPRSRVVLKFLRTQAAGVFWHYILPLSVRWRLYSWRAPTDDFKENLHLQTLRVPEEWRHRCQRTTLQMDTSFCLFFS